MNYIIFNLFTRILILILFREYRITGIEISKGRQGNTSELQYKLIPIFLNRAPFQKDI